MSHTEGPWKATRHRYAQQEHDVYWHVNQDHDGLQGMGIADVWGLDSRPGKEDEHNAHLIAAAPELYETCKLIVRAYENADAAPEALDRAYAAIAKAEGREQA